MRIVQNKQNLYPFYAIKEFLSQIVKVEKKFLFRIVYTTVFTRQEISKTRKQNMALLNSWNNVVKLAHVLTRLIVTLVAPGSTPLWVKPIMKSQPWTSSWYPYNQAWGCHWQLWRLHQTIAMAYKSNPWIVMLRRYWNILFIIPLDFYNYRIDYNFHLPHPTWTHQKLEMKRIANFYIYVFFSLATFF